MRRKRYIEVSGFRREDMKRIAVYCGSCMGSRVEYRQAAEELGHLMASRNIGLVYGGGRVGLMGAIAKAVLDDGGEAIGVIPRFLEKEEIVHRHLTELHVVDTMHQRKMKMAELADGFIALPGGFGTLEELFEMLTWGQIGHHQKPVALLNVSGYFDPLLEMIRRGYEECFIRPEFRDMMIHDSDQMRLLDRMESFQPIKLEKWSGLEKV
jgi:uncharacterized protein (TIGR00730 family)